MAKKRTEDKPEGRKDYNVTPQEFIRAWESSSTAEEVAEILGMPKAIVLARASNYRLQGVKLKKMPRQNKRKLDVDALNTLIEDLKKENPPD
jgi:hypothetical protein